MTRQEATEFYHRHSRPLFNAALRITGNPQEAEEIMQDAILKFLTRPARTGTEARTAAWLRTTCIRMALDCLRKRRRENLFLLEYAAGEDETDDVEDLPTQPDVMQIKAAMEHLPKPYGLVLDLVLIEGLDYREIARMTGTKEGTLRSLFARGKKKLAEQLRKSI